MWPFKKRTEKPAKADGGIVTPGRIRAAWESQADAHCPICGSHAEYEDSYTKKTVRRMRSGYSAGFALTIKDRSKTTTHYFCGTELINERGKRRVVAKCLKIEK